MEFTINMDKLPCNSSYNFTSKLLQVVMTFPALWLQWHISLIWLIWTYGHNVDSRWGCVRYNLVFLKHNGGAKGLYIHLYLNEASKRWTYIILIMLVSLGEGGMKLLILYIAVIRDFLQWAYIFKFKNIWLRKWTEVRGLVQWVLVLNKYVNVILQHFSSVGRQRHTRAL